jgi:hypothetical protein
MPIVPMIGPLVAGMIVAGPQLALERRFTGRQHS